MIARPVRKLYTPIERIPPLYPPHSYADGDWLFQSGEETRMTRRRQAPNVASAPAESRLPHNSAAGTNGMPPSAAPSPSYPTTYTSLGLKRSLDPPKGGLLDARA